MTLPADAALRIGDWRVDPARDVISRGGSTVKLERRTMQLLLCLAENAGQVVSLDQLLDRVWAGVVVTPDSVYHAVATLRRQLADDSRNPTYITSVPRRGYSLVASVAPWVDEPAAPALVASDVEVATSSVTFKLPGTVAWRRRLLTALSIGVVIALGYIGIDRLWLTKRVTAEHSPTMAATAIVDKSIAVLPFVDLSEGRNQEYLGDGMAEDIIGRLAQIPDLRVPARTSSFYFKGRATKVPDIARELGVAQVLEGSVRRSGDHLRVTAQLVRADNGYHLWSQSYDRKVGDVFQVQDEIVNSVVQALQVAFMGGPLTRRRGGTQNLEAYQLYLQAMDAQMQNTRSSLQAARQYFEQAIKLDPDFGLAWAEMARAMVFLADNGALSYAEGYESARQMAQHAQRVSPDLAEAHAMLQLVHLGYDWDWAATDAEGRQALALDPSNPTALMFAGALAYTLGRWDDAERQLRLALVRDPLSTIALFHLGTAQYSAGRFADAEATYRRLLELAPRFVWTRGYLGKTLLAEGRPDEALAVVQQENDEENRLQILPILLQAAGRKAEADRALAVLATKYAESDAYAVAATYAYRGDHSLALQWLDRAYKQRDSGLMEIVGEHLFRNIADDTRYKAFLRKMNLPE